MSEQSDTPTGRQVPASSTQGTTPSDAVPPPSDAVPPPSDAVPPPSDAVPPPPAPPSSAGGGPAAVVEDRPEVAVGAAFAGGFVLALILKRLAS